MFRIMMRENESKAYITAYTTKSHAKDSIFSEFDLFERSVWAVFPMSMIQKKMNEIFMVNFPNDFCIAFRSIEVEGRLGVG